MKTMKNGIDNYWFKYWIIALWKWYYVRFLNGDNTTWINWRDLNNNKWIIAYTIKFNDVFDVVMKR